MRLIFPNFFYCFSIHFRYFATELMFKKSQSVPLLHFSALCDLPETSKKFRKKIRNFFFSIFSFLRAFVVSSCRKSGFRFRVFLSLRYGADLGRSLLFDPNCHLAFQGYQLYERCHLIPCTGLDHMKAANMKQNQSNAGVSVQLS